VRDSYLLEGGQALGYLPTPPFPPDMPRLWKLNRFQVEEIDEWYRRLPDKTGYELDRIEWTPK
jgi:hypothetical protein